MWNMGKTKCGIWEKTKCGTWGKGKIEVHRMHVNTPEFYCR
jgi:hypothetical protein